MASNVSDLPHALAQGDELARRLAGKVPAVFLDYDGTLTPIVDRPEDAVISQDMRNAVRRLAKRSPEGTIEREEGAEFEALLDGVRTWLHEELDPIEGALVEPKRTSVAIHYRLVSDEERPRVKEVVDTLLAGYPAK